MPIVFMNDDTRFVGEVIRVMRMPASVALAYDGCGCAESGRHDHHGADCGCGKDISEHILLVSMGPLPGVQNTLAGPSVPRRNENSREVWAKTTTGAGVAQGSTRPADASMTKEALHRAGIIV